MMSTCDRPAAAPCWCTILCSLFFVGTLAPATPLLGDELPVAEIQAAAAPLDWYSDYDMAYRAARKAQRLLLINFVRSADDPAQRELETLIDADRTLRAKMGEFTLLRLNLDATSGKADEETRLLDHAAFAHMEEQAGIAVIDLAHVDMPCYGRVVSCFPFNTGKYYRWRSEYLPVILGLPAGSLTQRTMIWAVRVHPESPASSNGVHSVSLADAARRHSEHQASIGLQGHHNWETRYHRIRASVSAADAVEVVAESWPDQDLIDSCLDCVASWRYSSGHWGAVKRRHRMFGFDIRRGRNRIWYGTGIFAN